MIELFNLPPIIGMIPLLLFIVFAFAGVSQMLSLVLATVLCMVLSGTGLIAYSAMLCESMGGTLCLIGLVILLSSGLGKLLEQSGVSHTMVYSIVQKVGVKTENQGIIVTILCSTLVCGMLGTLAGGNAIIAPIIIPVVAAVGLSKSTVGAIFQNAGETGLILGPLSPAVVALLSLTGLSYGKMMLCAAIPFAAVWLVTTFFAVKRLQKTTRETENYEDEKMDSSFVPTSRHKKITVLFLVSFAAFVLYGIMTKSGTTYLPVVMICLIIIVGACSGEKSDQVFKTAITGMSGGLSLFILFLLFGPMFTMMTGMGAFTALAELFAKFVTVIGTGTGALSQAVVMIMGSLVGGFGIEGASVVQMQITNQLFAPILEVVHMPMELWAVALIAASRITNIIYPSANMIGQMGIARSDNKKSMLKTGWTVTVVTFIFIIVYAFAGAAFLY